MTNKHATGKYLIYLFDTHGTKQSTVSAESLTSAEEIGDKAISKPPFASYVIVRILKNTLDNYYPWTEKDNVTIGREMQ